MLQELTDAVGIVGEVGVHLEHVVRTVLERVAEAVAVGRAQPHLARALDEMHAALARHPLTDGLGRAVG